ncbi:MAG: ATP-binding protein [Bacteroidota bacterium]
MKTQFNFPSKIENLSIVEKLIDDLAADYKFSSEVYGNILVATVEAVNNAILHGNKLDESKNVSVSCEIEDTFLSISIKDEGPGFDYQNIPDPTAPENIEKPHGRGIFLMKHLVDSLDFRLNGAEVELKFKLS